jgi:hypothetical protein
MEKELGIPKPGDLFIGVIDFFAVLVPGLLAAALIAETLELKPQTDVISIFALLTAGWVLGHVLHAIGSLLDPLIYDPFFKPDDAVHYAPAKERSAIQKYVHKNDELYRLAKAMTDVPEPAFLNKAEGAHIPGGMYQWARSWLNAHAPEASVILDRLEADSKLFRSLSVLLLIAIPVLGRYRPVLIPLDIGAVVFSLWRYCDLRNKMIRQCYLNYVQRRFEARDERKAYGAGAM